MEVFDSIKRSLNFSLRNTAAHFKVYLAYYYKNIIYLHNNQCIVFKGIFLIIYANKLHNSECIFAISK